MNDADALQFVIKAHEAKAGAPLAPDQRSLAEDFYSTGLSRGRNSCGRWHINEEGARDRKDGSLHGPARSR